MINDASFKKQINWNIWVPPILYLVFLVIEKQAFGTYYSSWIFGFVFIFFGILYSVRYKLLSPAIILCMAGITLWHYVLASHFNTNLDMLRLLGMDIPEGPYSFPLSMMTWVINLLIFLVLILIFGPALVKAFQMELLARKIFKAAAQPVSTSENGFTSRPFYAGNTQYSKDQITGFTQYLSGHRIVYPVFTETSVFLTFSMGKSPLAILDPAEVSFISFDYTGNITVHIAGKDYKKFRKKLTFDRLCESMGNLFGRFLDYYINNQEARILSELKSA